jgi:hypothetical protein
MMYGVVHHSVSWRALYVPYVSYITPARQFKSNRKGPVCRPWAVAQASARASAQKSAHGIVARLMRAAVGGDKKTA